MRNQLARVFLTLLAIIPAAACDDEPLSPAHAGAPSEVETAAADEQASIGGPRDLAAMEAIVNTFDEAWTAGDFVRYAAQYAGAEWVGPDGTILTDPAAITGLYEFVIGTLFANTTRTSTIRRLTFLTGTVTGAPTFGCTQIVNNSACEAGEFLLWNPGTLTAGQSVTVTVPNLYIGVPVGNPAELFVLSAIALGSGTDDRAADVVVPEPRAAVALFAGMGLLALLSRARMFVRRGGAGVAGATGSGAIGEG